MATFDPDTYSIMSPGLRTFRVWLEHQNIRYTRFSVPHPCPLCTEGPTNELVYVTLSQEIAAHKAAGEPVPRDLDQRCAKLRLKLRHYRVHLAQLATARSEAKEVEDNLKP